MQSRPSPPWPPNWKPTTGPGPATQPPPGTHSGKPLRVRLLFPRRPVELFQHPRIVGGVREAVAKRGAVQDAVGEVFAHPYEVVFALDLVKHAVLPEVVFFQDRILFQEPEGVVEVESAAGPCDLQIVAALEVHAGVKE